METITQGTLIAERYRMIREIGFGGMGTVWLAYDGVLDSQCAVKLIGSTQAKHEEFRIRFECEAKCAAQLRGAHVVDVLDRGEWQGKPFIVMEYLEGEDLAMRLERLGRLDARATYHIVAQVARALMRAHALGIVHRDIKPGNVFLVPGDDHEIAKVLDFGVAKHRALPNAFESPISGQFIGTPCYMSPEQASSGTVDSRSDLWALSVMTFECLTGELPFQDESVLDMIQAITRGAVPSLTARCPELPAAVEVWWRRATAREAQRRFQSAKELVDALAEALDVYLIPVSGFPQASVDAPTVLDPLSIVPAARRPALAQRPSPFAPRKAYETDAAVTLHAAGLSSTGQLEKALRGRRRRVSRYVLAASALCAGLALAANAWRPTALDQVVSGLGFAAMSDARPLPRMADLREGAESRAPRAPEAPALTLAPEPTVALAAEPRAAHVVEPRKVPTNSAVSVVKPSAAGVAASKPNTWRPLAPPVPSVRSEDPELAASRSEKDYGI